MRAGVSACGTSSDVLSGFALRSSPCATGVCNARSDVYSLGKIMALLLPRPQPTYEPPGSRATGRSSEPSAHTDVSRREDDDVEGSRSSRRRGRVSDAEAEQQHGSSSTFLHRQLVASLQRRCVRSDPAKRLASEEVLRVLNDIQRISAFRHVRHRETHAGAGFGRRLRRGKYGWLSCVSWSLL